MTRLLVTLLVLVLGAGAVLSDAHARTPTRKERAEAKKRFAAAEAHFAAGKYAEAAAEYQASYELSGFSSLFFNIGQSYRLAGDRPRALEAFKRYLVEEPGGSRVEEARSYIVVIASEVEAERRLGDEEAARREAAAKAAAAEARRVEEERRRAEEARANEEAAARRREEAAERRSEQRRSRRKLLRIGGIAVAAAGVLLVGVGAYEGIQAKQRADEVSGVIDEWRPEHDQAIADGEAAERNMYIFYGAGAVAVAGGVVLYYFGARGSDGRASERRVGVDTVVTPSFVGATATARF